MSDWNAEEIYVDNGHVKRSKGWTLEVWSDMNVWYWQAIAGTYDQQCEMPATQAYGCDYDTKELAMAAADAWLAQQEETV